MKTKTFERNVEIVKLKHLSRDVRKHIFTQVLPAKIRISLRIYAVWLESSLDAFWIAKYAKFLYAVT